MTVLRMEVWLSIVGALTLTGIMIWILDKYSPYSARNNKKIYPYPCRSVARGVVVILFIFIITVIIFIIGESQGIYAQRELLVRSDFVHASGWRRSSQSAVQQNIGRGLLALCCSHAGNFYR